MRALVASIALLALQAAWLGSWLAASVGQSAAAAYTLPLGLFLGAALFFFTLAASPSVQDSPGAPTLLGPLFGLALAIAYGYVLARPTFGAALLSGSFLFPILAMVTMISLAGRLAAAAPSPAMAWRQTQVALVAFILLALWPSPVTPQLGVLVVLAFAAAAPALALTRLDEAVSGGGQEGQTGRGWPGLLAAATALALALGLAFFSVLGALIDALLRWPPIGAAYRALLGAVFALISVIVNVAAWLVEQVFAWLVGPGYSRQIPPPPTTPDPNAGTLATPPELGAWFSWVAGGIFAILLVSILAAWLLISLRRYRGTRRLALNADVASELSARRLAADAAAVLAAAMAGWRRRLSPTPADAVRQAYRHFLRFLAARGSPRLSAETPGHFAPRAESALALTPDDEAIRQLTTSYERVRYGDATPGAGEVDALRRGWRRIRQSKRS